MLDIFKWFFGIIGVIILIYVMIVVVRSFLSFGLGTISTSSTTTVATSTGTTTTSGFTLASFLAGFHPFQFAPIEVVPSVTEQIFKDSERSFQENYTDYNSSYFGNGYYNNSITNQLFNTNINNMPSPTFRKLPPMIYPSPNTSYYGRGENYYNYTCVVSGCNMDLCLDRETSKRLVTTCVYNPASVCYRKAICGRNPFTGKCGWKIDNELASCLQRNI